MRTAWTEDSPFRRRSGALLLALGAAAPLLIAWRLAPDPAGHGTHTQIGLPSCGWAVALDQPCPTCGMTTAFSHAVRGDLLASLAAQPMGTALALLSASVFWAGLHVAITGCRLGRLADLLLSGRALWITAGAAGAAWVYKLLTW